MSRQPSISKTEPLGFFPKGFFWGGPGGIAGDRSGEKLKSAAPSTSRSLFSAILEYIDVLSQVLGASPYISNRGGVQQTGAPPLKVSPGMHAAQLWAMRSPIPI